MNKNVEQIIYNDKVLAYVVRTTVIDNLDSTLFITPGTTSLQVGVSVHKAGSEIVRHEHLPIVREIFGTSEVVFVKEGKCIVDIYTSNRELVASPELSSGDVIVLIDGGHGFRMLENTNLFEVKQGPYAGEKDKERW